MTTENKDPCPTKPVTGGGIRATVPYEGPTFTVERPRAGRVRIITRLSHPVSGKDECVEVDEATLFAKLGACSDYPRTEDVGSPLTKAYEDGRRDGAGDLSALRMVATEAQAVWSAWNQNPCNDVVLEHRFDDLEEALIAIPGPDHRPETARHDEWCGSRSVGACNCGAGSTAR